MAEEVVEHADDLGRWEAFRERREVDDVGEQDRRGAELVRDRPRLGLQPVGDRPGQDVEQQVVGPLLRVPALAGEHSQQREDDRAAHGHVGGEHRGREPAGNTRRHATQQLSSNARAEEHDEVSGIPASRAADVAEHERGERRQDSPQTDPAGVEEASQRDHRQRRSKQDGQLADTQEGAEVPCAREDDDR